MGQKMATLAAHEAGLRKPFGIAGRLGYCMFTVQDWGHWATKRRCNDGDFFLFSFSLSLRRSHSTQYWRRFRKGRPRHGSFLSGQHGYSGIWTGHICCI